MELAGESDLGGPSKVCENGYDNSINDNRGNGGDNYVSNDGNNDKDKQ